MQAAAYKSNCNVCCSIKILWSRKTLFLVLHNYWGSIQNTLSMNMCVLLETIKMNRFGLQFEWMVLILLLCILYVILFESVDY